MSGTNDGSNGQNRNPGGRNRNNNGNNRNQNNSNSNSNRNSGNSKSFGSSSPSGSNGNSVGSADGNKNKNFKNRNKNRNRNRNKNYNRNRPNAAKGNNRKSNNFSYKPVDPKPEWEIIDCPLCGKPVKDLYTAISLNDESDKRAHFECVIKDLESKEELEKDEKVCYLGKGSFGIIREIRNGGSNFFVRKRIQFENENITAGWRKDISADLKKGDKK
jgi:hypothetical protein